MNDDSTFDNKNESNTTSDDTFIIWFDGIVEGPRSDDAELKQFLNQLNRLGLAHFDLDLDGGMFSLLVDDTTRVGNKNSEHRQQEFSEKLNEFISWASANGPVESTLRCTEVHGEEARETLFSTLNGELRMASRARPALAEDLRRARTHNQSIEDVGWRPNTQLAAILVCLLLIVGAYMVWNTGMIHRALATEAGLLTEDTHAFDKILEMEITQEWGNYVIKIKRGTEYPDTVDKVDALIDKTKTTADRAAINAVADGQEIYCRLLDDKGQLLAFAGVSLRPLLTDSEAQVDVTLPGHMNAKCLMLAIDPGKKKKK